MAARSLEQEVFDRVVRLRASLRCATCEHAPHDAACGVTLFRLTNRFFDPKCQCKTYVPLPVEGTP